MFTLPCRDHLQERIMLTIFHSRIGAHKALAEDIHQRPALSQEAQGLSQRPRQLKRQQMALPLMGSVGFKPSTIPR